jgi:hypothetical protein
LSSCLSAFVVQMIRLVDRADAEFDVADARVGELFLQVGEEFLLLEGEFLDDNGIRYGNFKDAAFEAPGACVGGQFRAGGAAPGGCEVGVGLDAALAAGRDQLGEDVFDFFGAAGVVTTLLAVAACGEVGSGVGDRVVNGVLGD